MQRALSEQHLFMALLWLWSTAVPQLEHHQQHGKDLANGHWLVSGDGLWTISYGPHTNLQEYQHAHGGEQSRFALL